MENEITPSASLPADPRRRFASVYRVLNDAISAHAFPGCAFGVLAGGRVVLQDALGRFTYEDGAPSVTAETVYDVASLTKVVATTAAAMLLYQRDSLDLDMPLRELLPGFTSSPASAEDAPHVKLCHLLAHNSGLPGYPQLFRSATTPIAMVRACLALPIEAEPGTRTEYSDPGFILLGKALEAYTHDPLALWVRREIFQPLRMMATGFCPPRAKRSSIPPTEEDTTLRHRRIQGEVQDEHAWRLQGMAGHAGLFSNMPDLLRFADEILNAGRGTGPATGRPRLFDATTVEHFARRQGPEGSSRAMGWDTPSQNSSSGRHFSPHSIGHLGYSGCSLWMDLDASVAVVLLTNRTWPDRQCELIRSVRPAFHDAVREAL
jgi:CubicO group peptidase (beta-lactamase class C family)